MGVLIKKERNNGIDFLKILCMLMIIVLHITGPGGAMNECSTRTTYLTLLLTRALCYCSVNCFAMISGYVGNAKQEHLANIIQIWATILFYTLLITIFGRFLFRLPLTKSDWINAFLPISKNTYWYLTSFIGMSLFTPFFEKGFQFISKKMFIFLLMLMFLLFSIVPMFLGEEKFGVNLGYSALWLMTMYIFGTYIRFFETKKRLTHSKWMGMFFLSVIMLAFVQWGRETERINIHLMEYTNPIIVSSSVFLLLGFKDLNIKQKIVKVQRWIIPLNLSVYIIHMNPVIYELLIINRFECIGNNHPGVAILFLTIVTLFVYFACIIFDIPRFLIFKELNIKKKLVRLFNLENLKEK